MKRLQPSGSEIRKEVLDEIYKCVCQNRMSSYGDAEDNFKAIAAIWQQYLETRGIAKPNSITAQDVAAMMIAVKLSRIANDPNHMDSWIDAGGYSVCGAGIVKRSKCKSKTSKRMVREGAS